MKKESMAHEEKNENFLVDMRKLLKKDTAALCFIAPLIPEKYLPLEKFQRL